MALTDKLTNIANAIREKTGSTRTMNLEEMAAAVTNIKIENEIVPFIENTITNFSNEELTVISDYGFAGKNNMQSLYIPNVVGVGGYAFEECTALTEIHFEKHITFGMKEQSYFVFRGAKNAVKIEFNDGFNILNNVQYLFYSLKNIEALIIRGDNVPQLNNAFHFKESSIENGTGYIYVPAALVEQYKAATNWVTVADQIRAIEDYPEITGSAV